MMGRRARRARSRFPRRFMCMSDGHASRFTIRDDPPFLKKIGEVCELHGAEVRRMRVDNGQKSGWDGA